MKKTALHTSFSCADLSLLQVTANYKTQLYDPRTNGFAPSSPEIGMHVEIRDPDDKIIMSKVVPSFSLFFSRVFHGIFSKSFAVFQKNLFLVPYSFIQSCGSGSGRIRNFLSDPDSDPE
jgi:hypothetical protein